MAGSLTQKPRRIHHRNTETQKKADRLTLTGSPECGRRPQGAESGGCTAVRPYTSLHGLELFE